MVYMIDCKHQTGKEPDQEVLLMTEFVNVMTTLCEK